MKKNYSYQGLYDNIKSNGYDAFNLGNDFWPSEEALIKRQRELKHTNRCIGIIRYTHVLGKLTDIKVKMLDRKTYT